MKNTFLKESDICFLVLAPYHLRAGIKPTVNSIKLNAPQASFLILGDENYSPLEIEQESKLGKFLCGGKKYTQLLSAGLQHMSKPFAFTTMAGNYIKPAFLRKYQIFCSNLKQILYIVYDRMKWGFYEAGLNGMLLPKTSVEEIGPFPDIENLNNAKLLWNYHGIEKKYKFIGLVGL